MPVEIADSEENIEEVEERFSNIYLFKKVTFLFFLSLG